GGGGGGGGGGGVGLRRAARLRRERGGLVERSRGAGPPRDSLRGAASRPPDVEHSSTAMDGGHSAPPDCRRAARWLTGQKSQGRRPVRPRRIAGSCDGSSWVERCGSAQDH